MNVIKLLGQVTQLSTVIEKEATDTLETENNVSDLYATSVSHFG